MVRDLVARGWEVEVITSSSEAASYREARVHVVPPATWPQRWADRLLAPLRALRGARRAEAGAGALKSAGIPPDPAMLRRRAEALPIWRIGQRLPAGVLAMKSYNALIGIAGALDWAHRSGDLGVALHRRTPFNAVIVSTPPHATQWAGHRITARTGLPYIADYRDPWATGVHELDGYDSPVSRVIGGYLERRVQSTSHVVVHNNGNSLERAMAQPRLPRVPRVSIPNGYDGEPTTARPDPTAFRILFSGWIHPFMDPRVLLRAVEALRQEDPAGTSSLRLEFIGSPTDIEEMPMTELVQAYGLGDCTTFAARVSREEAMRAQEQAAVLVAFDCPHPLAVAMKFYDYLLMRGDLLLIAERDSALDRAAQQLGQRAVPPGDHAGLVAALRGALARWHAGDYPSTHDPERVFHRSHRVAEFEALFASLPATGAGGAPVARSSMAGRIAVER